MPLFNYYALNNNGKKICGIIDADSLESAKERLKNQQVIIIKVFLSKKSKQPTLSTSVLINFTSEMYQLLHAGLPLYECLLTIEEKYRTYKSHIIFLNLCDNIKQGRLLSEALSIYDKTFDKIYISMITAGEKSGNLDGIFFQLFKLISRGEKFRRQVQSAMIYPIFLISFCSVVLFGLFFFLVPSMRELLEDRKLHPITYVVLSISKWLTDNWLSFFFLMIFLIFFFIFLAKNKKVREKTKGLLLKVPIFKDLFTQAVLIRFCRSFSVLTSTGVPIIQALQLSRNVMKHSTFEKIIKDGEDGLVNGIKLSQTFQNSQLIPPLMRRMIATAEETGTMSDMFMSISQIYEEMLEKTLFQFTNLLQPVILLILGMLVGLVLLAVLLPLTDVSTLT